MLAPVPGPFSCPLTRNHLAGEITRARRYTICCCTVASCSAVRAAAHGWASHYDMAFACDASRRANQPYQYIARNARVCRGTRVTGLAASIHLARRNSGEPDPWTFCAPDWAIAVPHADRSACECLPGRNDGSGDEEGHYHVHSLPVNHGQIPQRISLPSVDAGSLSGSS